MPHGQSHTLEICQPQYQGDNALSYLFVVDGSVSFQGGGTDAFVSTLPSGLTAVWGLVRAPVGACRPYSVSGTIVHAEIGDGPGHLKYDGKQYTDMNTFRNQVVQAWNPDGGTDGGQDGTNGTNGGQNGQSDGLSDAQLATAAIVGGLFLMQ